MKKVCYFIMICLCVLGAVGGICYSILDGEYPVAVGILALSITAWPEFKEYIVKIML